MSCDHNCSSCTENCKDRDPKSLLAVPNKGSNIKKIIGVISGKGGVGKSLVSTMLAVKFNKLGYKVGILDADITGPSIPKSFGLKDKVLGDDTGMYPVETKGGIKVMSINLLLEDESKPVVWRGPVIGGALKQFYSDTIWGDIDYLFVDMPPGTGDVALTVFQSFPVDGVVIVSTPQDLVKMIVGKAVKMAEMMNIKIIGLIENMAYMNCPNCSQKVYPFGMSKLDETSTFYNINPLGSLPINPNLNLLVDKGLVENCEFDGLEKAIEEIKKL